MKPKADAIRAYEDLLRTDPGNVPYRGYAEERLQEWFVSPAWNPLLRCIDELLKMTNFRDGQKSPNEHHRNL